MWVQIDRRMAEITGATIGVRYEKLSAASLSAEGVGPEENQEIKSEMKTNLTTARNDVP